MNEKEGEIISTSFKYTYKKVAYKKKEFIKQRFFFWFEWGGRGGVGRREEYMQALGDVRLTLNAPEIGVAFLIDATIGGRAPL